MSDPGLTFTVIKDNDWRIVHPGNQTISLAGPLPLRIALEGRYLWFPRGVDPLRGLKLAARIFWEALEQSCPGYEIRENPQAMDAAP